MWCSHTMEYYSARTSPEELIRTTRQMSLGNTINTSQNERKLKRKIISVFTGLWTKCFITIPHTLNAVKFYTLRTVTLCLKHQELKPHRDSWIPTTWQNQSLGSAFFWYFLVLLETKTTLTLSKREIFIVLSVAASSMTGGPSSKTLRRNSFD